MLTLMREEQARTRRLEHKLYAQELEQQARRTSPPPYSGDDQTQSKWRKREKNGKHVDTKNDSNDEEIESIRQKFMVFLARSDAQTDSG